ncbi:uncharacterized protein LOC113776141 [Coffea eugenioides]|uniref:uncharacterized protein LOC113776141 n=1 Tax=Coffea eugenioides TaxID=49369 RepID=UPI000F60BAEA|nr:uncharacterized protein LOC113776141 [Coffea eugenioides]
MSGLSKHGAALTIIFVLSLVALFAQLFYFLWRRRVFQPQTPPQAATTTAPTNSHTFSDPSTNFASSLSSSSKELLCFLCLSSSRVEPTSTPPSLNSTAQGEDDMEVIDIFKLRNLYGPSRVLFTIKEEDSENDVEPEKSAVCSSATTKPNTTAKRVSLEECFNAADDGSIGEEAEAVVALAIGGDRINNAGDQSGVMTPISTPCESPLYFTPSASPVGGGAGQMLDKSYVSR